MFVVNKPDVFKSQDGKSYIIFGEAKIEDLKEKEQLAAQQSRQERGPDMSSRQQSSMPQYSSSAPTASGHGEENVDESGVDPKDIELVTSQANCSRADAVRALRNNNSDIVNAIMELTM